MVDMTDRFEWPDLTEDERHIRQLARDVAEREIAPRALKHDLDGTFVRDSIDALAESGLLGINIPKEYGGLGGSRLSTVIALEAISAACGSTGASYCFHILCTHWIVGAGPENLRQEYLPGLAKNKLGALSLNERVKLFFEPFETNHKEQNDHYVLNGYKPFVTSAGEADVYVVQTQRTGTGQGLFPVLDQDYLVVDRNMPGVGCAEVYDPMGLRGASNGAMKFEDAKVPKDHVLAGLPYGVLKGIAVKEEAGVAPQVVAMGLAGSALDAAVRKSREKGVEEWVLHRLATMTDKLNALRYYHYVAARFMAADYHPTLQMQTDMRRLGGDECIWICDNALEVYGAGGFMRTNPMQRYHRDSRVSAWLMFSLDERRYRVGKLLLERDALLDFLQEPTMPWDPAVEYIYMFVAGNVSADMPPQLQKLMTREVIERFARSRGEKEVTLQVFGDYGMQQIRRAKLAAPILRLARRMGINAPDIYASPGEVSL